MQKSIILLFLLSLSLFGCAKYDTASPIDKTMNLHESLDMMSKSTAVERLDIPYLGASSTIIDTSGEVLDQLITIKREGDLSGIARSISSVSSVPVEVVRDSVYDGFDRIIPFEATKQSLKDILNLLEGLTGVSWYYDQELKLITFSYYRTRTYTIYAAAGAFSYESTITNQNKSASATTGLGSSGGESSSDSQRMQQNKTSYSSDPIGEVEIAIKSSLSKDGHLTKNRSAGTITVTDTSRNMRVIDQVIKDLNKKLEKQVVISVKVYSFTANKANDFDFSLQGILEAGGVKYTVGSGLGVGALSALVVDKASSYNGSQIAINALMERGEATLITSGTGITMNNQPYPLQNVRKEAYLASVSMQNGDYGQQISMNPGEITQGFSMTVIPHILDNRKVILQYNLSLASLDEIEEYSNNNIKIQLPKISTKSFSQRVGMNMGQTLILAGFSQDTIKDNSGLGLFNVKSSRSNAQSMIVIVIDCESVGNPIEGI